MESVGNLFGTIQTEIDTPKSIWILDMIGSPGYADNHSVTCPDGYKWTDFERIEIYAGWSLFTDSSQSITTTTVAKEQIALNPNGWFGRINVDTNNYTDFRANAANMGVTFNYGSCRIIGIKGYLKEDTYLPAQKDLLVAGDFYAWTDIDLSASVLNYDYVEVTAIATHQNAIDHKIVTQLDFKNLNIDDRALMCELRDTTDLLIGWLDYKSETKLQLAGGVAGVWKSMRIVSVHGVKLTERVVQQFVGRPNDNQFINPNMEFWQGVSEAARDVVPGNYINDGWLTVSDGAKNVYRHVDSKGKSWLGISGGGTSSYKFIAQRLPKDECLGLLDENGYLTVSYLYNTKSNDTNDTLALQVYSTSVLHDFNGANLNLEAESYQPMLKGVDEQLVHFTVKIDDLTKIQNGLELRIGTYNKSSVGTTNPADAPLLITACKLEWGKHYTKCLNEKTADGLHRCERYVQDLGFLVFGDYGYGGTGTYYLTQPINYRCEMFKSPQPHISNYNHGGSNTSVFIYDITEKVCRVQITKNVSGVPNVYGQFNLVLKAQL